MLKLSPFVKLSSLWKRKILSLRIKDNILGLKCENFLMHKPLSLFFRIPYIYKHRFVTPSSCFFLFYPEDFRFPRMVFCFLRFLVLPGAFLFSQDEFYSPIMICSPWITFVLPGFIWFSPDEVEFCSARMSFVLPGWNLFSPGDFCSHRMSFFPWISFVLPEWVL